MKMLVKKTVLATSVALATLIAAQAAYAQRHHAAPETYDTQANPRFGLVRRFPRRRTVS